MKKVGVGDKISCKFRNTDKKGIRAASRENLSLGFPTRLEISDVGSKGFVPCSCSRPLFSHMQKQIFPWHSSYLLIILNGIQSKHFWFSLESPQKA